MELVFYNLEKNFSEDCPAGKMREREYTWGREQGSSLGSQQLSPRAGLPICSTFTLIPAKSFEAPRPQVKPFEVLEK